MAVAIQSTRAYSSDHLKSLEISLDKQTYVVHEQIWLDVTQTSITSDALHTFPVFSSPDNKVFAIEIRDQAGNLMPFCGLNRTVLTLPGRPKPLRLEPGEQDHGCVNLAWHYGVPERDTAYPVPLIQFAYFHVGRYSVLVRHDGAISNEFSFTVVRPDGDEEKVLRLLEEAAEAERDGDFSASAQLLRDVAEKYPESVFARQCYYLSMYHDPEWRSEYRSGLTGLKALYAEMLHKYPNYGESVDWLNSVTFGMEDNVKLEFLDSLSVQNPGTRAAKFATQMKIRLLKQKEGE